MCDANPSASRRAIRGDRRRPVWKTTDDQAKLLFHITPLSLLFEARAAEGGTVLVHAKFKGGNPQWKNDALLPFP